jgi:hypothetical protein
MLFIKYLNDLINLISRAKAFAVKADRVYDTSSKTYKKKKSP